MAEEGSGKGKVVPMKGSRCPVCGRPQAALHRPFCSRRCAYLDLGRWLGGDYRIATDEEPDEGGEPPPMAPTE